jgi:hypothetical protein
VTNISSRGEVISTLEEMISQAGFNIFESVVEDDEDEQ